MKQRDSPFYMSRDSDFRHCPWYLDTQQKTGMFCCALLETMHGYDCQGPNRVHF